MKASNEIRRKIYRREGFACALCDDNRSLQVHHIISRAKGGSNHEHNLICLCMKCHALAHGTYAYPCGYITREEAIQAIFEYMADMYPGEWNPWHKDGWRPSHDITGG